MLIKISTCKNVLDNTPKNLFLTKDSLIKLLTQFSPGISTKKTAPAFIAGHFGGTKRITENLQSRTLITLDLDHCNIALSDLKRVLEASLTPYGYCAYSTASHSLKEPKIRIVLFLENEIGVVQYKTVATNFINSIPKLKPYIDINASTTPGQLMFLPFRSSSKYQPWYKIQEGKNVDAELFMEPIKNDHAIHKISFSDTLESFTDAFDKTVKQQPLDITKEEVIAYLKLYPKKSCNYDNWLEVGECLHHQFRGNEEGRDIWYQWSLKHKQSDNNIDNIAYKWKSFKTDKSKLKTFASIIKKANSYKIKLKKVDTETIKPICKSKWIQTKGKNLNPLSGQDNFQVLFDEYNIKINYDEILKTINVSYNGNQINDANEALTFVKLLCEINGLKSGLAHEVIKFVASRNTLNSWKDLILSHSNAKTDNFDKLCASITVEPEYKELKRLYLKKWLIQMLHMTCLNDGHTPKSARMVLVFQGKQGIGKTSWFRSLVPDDKRQYVLEGHTLDVSNHMNQLTALSHVFVELGELGATFRKSDMEQLKSFITCPVDELNMKYVTHPVKYRRKTVFFGSVNDEKFLQDQTGNSRFLVLPVLKCNARHNINMLDLYAELLEEAKLEPDYDLNEFELNIQTSINSEFESINILKEKFEEVFDITKEGDTFYNATSTLEALGFSISSIRKNQTNEMAKILRDYGFTKSAKYRSWKLPPLKLKRDLFDDEE